jgi:ATP-dependent Clp protease protease subunit
MKFWNFTKNAATDTTSETVELRIDGNIIADDDVWLCEMCGIQAITPNLFKSELAQYANKPITVWIDSYGGDIFAAAGIYNALMEHKGAVTVKIDGKAMSSASVIAMAGGTIQMSPVALMMIHNPLTEAQGYASDLRKTADILDTVKDSIMNAYQLKTGKSRAKISQMMDDETYMDAKTAVQSGFADSMLYSDKQTDVMNFAFNRHAILNSANDSIKRMLALQKPPDSPPIDTTKYRALLALELEL